jgi:hypothetical protein
VHAFMEDICYPEAGGTPENCLTLPKVCLPVGTATVACRAAMATQFVIEGSGQQQGARSMVHADATFLLAQAVGFSPDDAWWITAFDEVCDYGKFQAYDMHGEPIDASTQTPTLEGFVRTNTGTGGTFFHYVSTYNGGSGSPAPGINGLVPDVTNESMEFFLAHLRRWAQAGTGSSPALCTGGLTTQGDAGSYGTGPNCYPFDGGGDAASSDAGNILWSTAIFAVGRTVTTNNATGLQVIHHPDGGAVVFSPSFDSIVGAGLDAGGDARIMNARLGIYLHALADRISHNVCTDTAAMAGPSDAGWTESWTQGECDQGDHVLFHAWETGVDFSQVPAANRTTINALSAVYNELLSFASVRGVGGSSTSDAGAFLGDIATALETAAAPARIDALAAVSCRYGFEPFPGTPKCGTQTSDAGDASSKDAGGGGGDADAAVVSSSSSGSGSGTSSSCSVGAGAGAGAVRFAGAALWLTVLGAFGIRRRCVAQPRSIS